jgi:hypothetical protein
MSEAVRRFAKSFIGLVWRLAVYLAVLVAATRLLSAACARAMHGWPWRWSTA